MVTIIEPGLARGHMRAASNFIIRHVVNPVQTVLRARIERKHSGCFDFLPSDYREKFEKRIFKMTASLLIVNNLLY